MAFNNSTPNIGDVADGRTSYSNGGATLTPFAGTKWNGSNWVQPGSLQSLSYEQVRDDANPFGQEAKRYQGSLANLLQNPGAMASNPMYQYSFDQGMEAINRTAAAKGQLGSGNRLMELNKFGQGEASKNFFNLADLYATLSGAKSQNAAGAAQAGVSAAKAQADAANGVRPIHMSGGMDMGNFQTMQLY